MAAGRGGWDKGTVIFNNQKFFFLKKPSYLFFRRLRAVTRVCDIHHLIHAEFRAECSESRFAAVRDPEHVANTRNDIIPFENEGDDRDRAHEGFNFGIEGLVRNVRVMLAK